MKVTETNKMDFTPRCTTHAPNYLQAALAADRPLTTDDFRQFLVEDQVPETCAHIQALGLPHRDHEDAPFASPLLRDFYFYLQKIMTILSGTGREEFIEVLMEHRLPFDIYLSQLVGFQKWIHESRINLFRLFFRQGYTLQDLKGRVEKYIANFGVIDVLDFLLSFETEETGHILHPKIVYYAVKRRNVDIIDRLIAKNYSMNELCGNVERVWWYYYLPIYASFSVKYDETAILDRLIVGGVNVNPVVPGIDCISSPLMLAYRERAMKCFQRLLDVGARIKNNTDIPQEIDYWRQITPEHLTLFVQAGMDLNYPTKKGTVLQIVRSLVDLPEDRRQALIETITNLGGH